MMKVTVTKYLNVRVGKPRLNTACYQYIAPGSELEVDGQLYKGDLFDGIDTWLKDEAGNFYWSGGVDHDIAIQDLLKLAKPAPAKKISFDWFNQLKIHNIWEGFNEKGDQAKVAVLDTGYNFSNPDISNRVSNSKILIDNIQYPGIQLTMNDQSNECHGTRCSSLIGAENNKDWIIGIAPQCKLIVGKISINEEIMDFDYIINGIKWAISQNADIISISYAFEDLKPAEIITLNQQLDSLLRDKNILIFAASGNSGALQLTAERYPASFDSCISVGASTKENTISPVTTLSNKTIIHAPGEKIESYNKQNIPTPESGTSFSTPIVAAIAALAVSFIKKKNNNQWDKTQLLNKIYSTADTIPNTNNKKVINPVSLFNNL